MTSSKIGGHAQAGRDAEEDVARTALIEALARWASGVAVLAVREEGRVFGITVTAFSAVSLEPPLVLVCLGRNAIVLPTLLAGSQSGNQPGGAADAPEFVVNILADDQRRLASIFTDVGPLGRDAFPAQGPPLLPDSLASLVCTVDALHEAGDHWIVIGRVRDIVTGGARPPLVRFQRAWHGLNKT